MGSLAWSPARHDDAYLPDLPFILEEGTPGRETLIWIKVLHFTSYMVKEEYNEVE